jgi:hypothetical protein
VYFLLENDNKFCENIFLITEKFLWHRAEKVHTPSSHSHLRSRRKIVIFQCLDRLGKHSGMQILKRDVFTPFHSEQRGARNQRKLKRESRKRYQHGEYYYEVSSI